MRAARLGAAFVNVVGFIVFSGRGGGGVRGSGLAGGRMIALRDLDLRFVGCTRIGASWRFYRVFASAGVERGELCLVVFWRVGF